MGDHHSRHPGRTGLTDTVNESGLAKLVVIVILLITFAIWRSPDRAQRPDCGARCPTDISASHK